MPFRVGDRVIVEFGIGDLQPGEVISLSDDGRAMTVRLGKGVMGHGDMPLVRRNDSEYDLQAGGTVTLWKLV
jgi:hypothetical protein